jgi:tRNA-splicing ligase RtcB
MMVNTEGKVPVKMWCKDVENTAMEQLKNLSNLPFAFKHIAAMPDCHAGYGMPIGGVLATQGVIIPNAVGVDIGCGMQAIKTDIEASDVTSEQLKKIMSKVREQIPVGFNHHETPQDMPSGLKARLGAVTRCEYDKATTQLGTLGGGNHFIEFQKGSDDMLWVMIHSGSRNVGLQVAKYYNKIAIDLNEKWFSEVPEKWELAFLPEESEEGVAYVNEMSWCAGFAYQNRTAMMDRIRWIIGDELGCYEVRRIDVPHNYARKENHYGRNVWVHRKGATSAREDETGIIPGSQGTASYVVRGLGSRESFMSCSHGAGRRMGRKEAQRSLNLKDEIKRLDDQGILHAIRNTTDLDEASGAYKDIDEVMEQQQDLVEIVTKLTPLAVIKG